MEVIKGESNQGTTIIQGIAVLILISCCNFIEMILKELGYKYKINQH